MAFTYWCGEALVRALWPLPSLWRILVCNDGRLTRIYDFLSSECCSCARQRLVQTTDLAIMREIKVRRTTETQPSRYYRAVKTGPKTKTASI